MDKYGYYEQKKEYNLKADLFEVPKVSKNALNYNYNNNRTTQVIPKIS